MKIFRRVGGWQERPLLWCLHAVSMARDKNPSSSTQGILGGRQGRHLGRRSRVRVIRKLSVASWQLSARSKDDGRLHETQGIRIWIGGDGFDCRVRPFRYSLAFLWISTKTPS